MVAVLWPFMIPPKIDEMVNRQSSFLSAFREASHLRTDGGNRDRG
jgi:hypothetical protein